MVRRILLLICVLFSAGYGCAGVSSVAYGLIARECERFDKISESLNSYY